MESGYTRSELLGRLNQYFSAQQFVCEEYSEDLGPVRVPLHCKRQRNGISEIVIVDVITDAVVSRERFLPEIQISGATIRDACPPRFFQYYVPHAKVFWAYPTAVSKGDGYEGFKAACTANGIGLLDVSETGVSQVVPAVPLAESLSAELERLVAACGAKDELARKILQRVSNHQQEYIHYLVYYGEPEFRRQALTSRHTQYLSLVLMDKLESLASIAYREQLATIGREYRKETRDDFKLALDTIQGLWRARFDLEYPDVHKDFEPVLLLNPRYRDHFIHAFQVFLIGAVIIDCLYDTSAVNDFMSRTGSLLEDAWLAAATYHDFNYPIQQFEDWMKTFFHKNLGIEDDNALALSLEGPIVRDGFLSKIRGLCSAMSHDVDDTMVRFVFEKAVGERNHGVLGALTFLGRFQDNNHLQIAAVNQAALGILLHDYNSWRCFCRKGKARSEWESAFCEKHLVQNVSFADLPIVFLLAFCDAAQEWGRPGRDYDTARARLEDIQVNGRGVWVLVSVESDAALDHMSGELGELKAYLKDKRFAIEVQSRAGRSNRFEMTGK